MSWARTPDDVERHGRQTVLVLQHLETGATLTQDDAFELYSIRRLASRISELRKAGYSIKTTRNHEGCATYKLVGRPEPARAVEGQLQMFELTATERLMRFETGPGR